jgi:hypothetical protein
MINSLLENFLVEKARVGDDGIFLGMKMSGAGELVDQMVNIMNKGIMTNS